MLGQWPAHQPVVGACAAPFWATLDNYGASAQVLTDHSSQYVSWGGKSAFSKELEKRGVHEVIYSPRHPQTLGKIERF
jgi:hypothetical protein